MRENKLPDIESLKDNMPYYIQNIIDFYKNDDIILESIRQDLIEMVAIVESIQYKNRLDRLPDIG